MTSPSCFVAMPLSTRPDEMEFYRDEAYWQRVFSHLIEPAVVRAGYRVLAPGRVGSEHITSEIVRDICTADMMVCDVSSANANVFFEMGLRTSLDLPVAIVRGQYSSPLPFDIHAINCYTYRFQIPIEDEIEALSQHLGNAMRTSSGRNTMWKVYGAAYTAERDSQLVGLRKERDDLRRECAELREQCERVERDLGDSRDVLAREFGVRETMNEKVSDPDLEARHPFIRSFVTLLRDLEDEACIVFSSTRPRASMMFKHWGVNIRISSGGISRSVPIEGPRLPNLIEGSPELMAPFAGSDLRIRRYPPGLATGERFTEDGTLAELAHAWLGGQQRNSVQY